MVRERRVIGRTGSNCSLCGHQGLVLTESRLIRRGVERLRLRFDPDARLYELCDGCGAKHTVETAA